MQRRVLVTIDEAALAEAARLDGCYALRTDLPKATLAEEIVHDRYKNLAQVEWTLGDSKTLQLEMRPVYLRDENRTRGHVLVVMLEPYGWFTCRTWCVRFDGHGHWIAQAEDLAQETQGQQGESSDVVIVRHHHAPAKVLPALRPRKSNPFQQFGCFRG